MDEPQNRFTTAPPDVSGIPARIATPFAMSIPWGPSGKAQPRTRSSICSGFRFSFLLNKLLTVCAAKSSGRIPTRFPFFNPIGERTASIITDSDILIPHNFSIILEWIVFFGIHKISKVLFQRYCICS